MQEHDNVIKILNNKKCQLFTNDINILKSLRKLLSFKEEGVEYTLAYKNGWDGYTFLMDKKGKFPLGLLFKVEQYFINNNIKYSLKDDREPVEFCSELDYSEKLKSLGLSPRDYQIEVAKKLYSSRIGIARAATGSGKSLIISLLTAKFNRPTIIYVIGISLLGQFHQTLQEIFDEPIGFIGNGECKIQRINVASVWTIGKALDVKGDIIDDDEFSDKEKYNESSKLAILEMLKTTDVHIFDECHTVSCNTIQEIHKYIDPKFIFGLSGTPFKNENTDMVVQSILGPKIIDVPASELIKRGVLAQPIIKFVDVPPTPVYSRTYHEVYSEYIVENEIRNNLILKETLNLVEKKYQTLVLFKQIKHGKKLFALFQENKINCVLLDGKNSLEERDEVKKKLLNREIDVILASTILDVGVDIPSISGMVLAGSGKSYTKAIQRIGRCIRGYPGKKYAAIVDFMDNCRYLKNHSKARYRIYSAEEGFILKLPKNSPLRFE